MSTATTEPLPPAPGGRGGGDAPLPPVLVVDRGRPVLELAAADADGQLRLLRHRAILEAGLPGVPRCVASAPGRLRLSWHGSHTLATRPPADPATVAAAFLALAATLAALHRAGFVHGRVRADHVVVDGTHRPTLVGLSGVVPASAGQPDAAAADVRALARLLVSVLDTGSTSTAGRRSWWTVRTEQRRRQALRDVGERILAVDGYPGPSARRLAHELEHLVPTARTDRRRPRRASRPHEAYRSAPERDERPARPERPDPGPDHPLAPCDDRAAGPVAPTHPIRISGPPSASPPSGSPPSTPASEQEHEPARRTSHRRRPWLRAVVGLLAAVVVGYGATALAVGPDPTRPGPAPGPGPGDDPVTRATAAPSASLPAPASGSSVPAPTGTPIEPTATTEPTDAVATVGGDGGAMLAGRRVAVGQPGDQVAAVDLACDGGLDLVLLRPATGEQFQVAGWHPDQPPRHGTLVARVAPASHLRVRVAASGCTTLAVVDPGGSSLPVRPIGSLR